MMMFNRFRSPICIWDYGQRSAAASICLGLHDNKNNPMEHMKLAIRRKRKEKEKKCLQFNQSINNTPIWRTVFPRWAWKRDKTEYRVKKHGPAGHQKSCIANRKRQRRYFEYNIDGMKDIICTQGKKTPELTERLIWRIVVKSNMRIKTIILFISEDNIHVPQFWTESKLQKNTQDAIKKILRYTSHK